jgi:hypothetical protein
MLFSTFYNFQLVPKIKKVNGSKEGAGILGNYMLDII